MEPYEITLREYASAIGTVILAFGDLEAEILSLIERLGSKLSRQTLEESSFGNRIKEMERLALGRCGGAVRHRIFALCATARGLGNQRDSFANGHLWRDVDGTHHLRSFLRRPGLNHDDRTPQQIIEVSYAIKKLQDDIAVLVTAIPTLA
jgi:hypothetical protein